MSTEPTEYSVTLEYEGAWTEVSVRRDWEGELQMQVAGTTGRTYVAVDVQALQDFRNFLSDVIERESEGGA